MDMKSYIAEHGMDETIHRMATRGPFSILAELGPGPEECRRIVAESAGPFDEVTVELVNGFIRTDFAVRTHLEQLLNDTDSAKSATIEGEDLRWQYVTITDGARRWRLRTYEGENANCAMSEEDSERAHSGTEPMSSAEREQFWDAALTSETLEEWRTKLDDDPHWPHSVTSA